MTYITPCPYTSTECKIIRDTNKSDSKIKLPEIKAREICTQADLQLDNTFELEDVKKFEVACNVKVIVHDYKLDCLYHNKSNVNPRKINIILNTFNLHYYNNKCFSRIYVLIFPGANITYNIVFSIFKMYICTFVTSYSVRYTIYSILYTSY